MCKHYLHSMHEFICTSKAVSISKMRDLVEEFKSNYEDMVQRIKIYHKQLERRDVGSKQRTADFELAASITVDSASVTIK